MNDFVVKHDLCPFAESVFKAGKIRYRVFMGSDESKIVEKIKFEMLHLMTTPEDEVLNCTQLSFDFTFMHRICVTKFPFLFFRHTCWSSWKQL